jgi:outer membrane protein insertion porin family
VGSIRFEGVRSVSEGALKKVLKTKSRSWIAFWRERPLLRQDFLRADTRTIELFFARSGFLDARASARVERSESSNLVRVVFSVEEGPLTRVRAVTWSGAALFPEQRLAEEIETRPAEPMDPVRLEVDEERLGLLYADHGRFPRIAASWTRDSLAADVHFLLDEGPAYTVGTIDISGVQKVDTFAVRRELLLEPGRVFRREDHLRSIERLYASSLFQVVDVAPTAVDTVRAVVDLGVGVRERKHKRVEGGVGLSSRDGFRLVGSWANLNLSGRGNRVNASASVWFSGLGGTETRVSYTEPWILGVRVATQLGAFLNQSRLNFRNAPYTERTYGPNLSFLREVGRFTKFLFSAEANWSDAISTPDLPPDELESFRDKYFTTRLVFAPSYDFRDDKFDARRGQFHYASAELGNLLSGADDDFFKLGVSGGWHFPRGDRSSLSYRLQLSRMWPFADATQALAAVPASELYRTGGSASVRGYAELELAGADGEGGVLLAVTNLEYRFPVWGVLSGAVFADGGNAWARITDFHLDQVVPPSPGTVLDPNQLRWSAGGGLRLSSPVGPLRLDLGYRLYRDSRDLQPDPPSRLGVSLSFGQVF